MVCSQSLTEFKPLKYYFHIPLTEMVRSFKQRYDAMDNGRHIFLIFPDNPVCVGVSNLFLSH